MVVFSIFIIDVRVQKVKLMAVAISELAHSLVMDSDLEPLDGSKNGYMSLSPIFVWVTCLPYELLEFLSMHVVLHDFSTDCRRSLDDYVSHRCLLFFDHFS